MQRLIYLQYCSGRQLDLLNFTIKETYPNKYAQERSNLVYVTPSVTVKSKSSQNNECKFILDLLTLQYLILFTNVSIFVYLINCGLQKQTSLSQQMQKEHLFFSVTDW